MSGRPNAEEVKQLKELLREFAYTRDEIGECQMSVATITENIRRKKERASQLNDDIKKVLSSMDVSSPGNFGYEARLFELLLLLSAVHLP